MTADLNNITVSSRVRLARNAKGVPFPRKLDNERAYELMKSAYDIINTGNNYDMHVMAQMTAIQRGAYVERHLISPALAESDRIGAVLVSKDEKVSVMLNEEDHVRAQCIEHGFNLDDAYKTISEIDGRLNRGMNIAYDSNWGYLTCCPTNLGTGMRASVMCFLPMLSLNNEMENCITALSRRYITVRGSYGEGSRAGSYMYQISNQASLGVSEEEILTAVSSAVKTVCEEEFKLLEKHFNANRMELTDTIWRAKGILLNAYKISSAEFISLFMNLKLGVTLGIVGCKDVAKLNRLSEQVLPNNLQVACGRELNEIERDLYRAEFTKKALQKILT